MGWDMILQSQLGSKQLQPLHLRLVASLQQCLLLHPSQTQTELSRQRDSTTNGLGLSVAEKGLLPASTDTPMGMGI